MPSNNSTPPRSRGTFPARDPRSAGYAKEMNRRRQANTVAIRKQRKEERLWKRRQGETTSTTAAATTATTTTATLTTAANTPVEPLSADLLYELAQQYCHQPLPEKLVALQRHMAHKQSETHTFLDQLLHNRISKCRLLVQLIAQQIHTLVTAPQHDNYNNATLGADQQNQLRAAPFLILLDISSHQRSSDKDYNNSNSKDREESYYGRPPPRWCDVLLETTNLVPQLIHYLIAIPSPSTTSTKNEDDSNDNIVITETIANTIGNLLQDAPSQTLPQVLPVWDPLVQKLPSTAYLCAAAVRQDGHHFGTDFLQALTPHVVAKLLHTNPYDAVWILEGLSKREEAAIDILCSSKDLLAAFAQSLEKHTYTNDKRFLVPALKAMANFCGSAHHVISFLSLQLPHTDTPDNTHSMDTNKSQSASSVNGFIPLVAAILDNGQIVDVLPVVSALVSESGIPNHPATMIAFPVLVPRLIQLVCSDQAVFYWKREAVWAMNEALCDYSINDDNASNSNSGNIITRNSVKSTLEALALTFFWNEHLPVPRDRLLEALADLLMGPDLDATTAVMHLLDKLLRMIPAARSEFETVAAGVHCLEQICVRGSSSGDWEVAANLAANLLDDFFDTEEDDDTAMQGFHFGANEAGQNQFSFGMQQHHQQGDFDFSQSGFSTPAPTGTSRGRGRGMTLPAWMQKS